MHAKGAENTGDRVPGDSIVGCAASWAARTVAEESLTELAGK
jgi:hypothetical protein